MEVKDLPSVFEVGATREMARTVCLQEPLEDCDVEVIIAAPGDGDEKLQSVVMYASSSLLSQVPFFAASLREPWQHSKRKTSAGKVCVLKLDCTAHSSPGDYIACLKFLITPIPPIKSVSAASKIMRCADHLLFKECVELCMGYLAAAPWSEEEEKVIRGAVSSMGLPLCSDLSERLSQGLDELRTFKDFFQHITLSGIASRGFDSGRVEAVVKEAVSKAPSDVFRSFYKPLFLEVWSKLTHGCFRNHVVKPDFSSNVTIAIKRDTWVSFTRILLLHTNAKADLAKRVAQASGRLAASLDMGNASFALGNGVDVVLINIFEGAVPGEHGEMVFLSISERVSLLAAWVPVVAIIKNEKLHIAFKNVFLTLPPQHPSVIRLVMGHQGKTFFKPCYVWWRSALSKFLKHADFLLDHMHLNVNNIDFYTKLLAGESE